MFNWLKSKASLVFDPNRDERIAAQAKDMWRMITQYKRAFNFDDACASLGVEGQDVFEVRARVYDDCLVKAWENGEIDSRERQSLDTVAALLRIPPEKQRDLEWAACSHVFQNALTAAFADGHLSEEERQALAKIAAGFGQPLGVLMRQSFAEEGTAFLSNLLDRLTFDGRFDSARWGEMVRTAQALGLSETDLQASISSRAVDVVHQHLAYAQADGQVSDAEYRGLQWLMNTFAVPAYVRQQVAAEVTALNALASIRNGNLPSVSPWGLQGLQLRAGEIVHYSGPAYFTRTKMRRNGAHVEQHAGSIAVTDSRLIFVSDTAGVDLNHRKVLSVTPGREYAEVQSGGKGTGCYYFTNDGEKAVLIYQVAIGRANQTIVSRIEGSATRHIPRDVRQRVWQAYGGKCAECGSTEYIEYDHIIPHARGGSNAEQNIQLLCRRCNLKKSDMI